MYQSDHTKFKTIGMYVWWPCSAGSSKTLGRHILLKQEWHPGSCLAVISHSPGSHEVSGKQYGRPGFTSCMVGTSTAECTSLRYIGCLLSFPFLLRSIAWKVIKYTSLNVARERQVKHQFLKKYFRT